MSQRPVSLLRSNVSNQEIGSRMQRLGSPIFIPTEMFKSNDRREQRRPPRGQDDAAENPASYLTTERIRAAVIPASVSHKILKN